MTKYRIPRVKQGTVYLLCVIDSLRYGSSLHGTEFSGGRLTGRLLDLKDIGALLFILAVMVVSFYPRIAAAIVLTASLLCFPLYFYFTVPGVFRWLLPGAYAIPLRTNFVWDTWAIVGVLVLATATFLSLRTLSIREDSDPLQSTESLH